MSDREWPVAFFDDDYLKIYQPQFTAERTSAEVDFIESALALSAGARVLDLACGIGRHAIGMATRGYRVTGLDFNAQYLAIAEEESRHTGTQVEWVQGDMRALRFEGAFDGIYSYFTSFGYYGDAENDAVLGLIARALAPGGRFLIDMANRDWVLTQGQNRTWNPRPDGALLMEEVSLDLRTSRVTSRQILIQPSSGAQVVKTFDLRVYTCAELTSLMSRHGLRVAEVWGGPDRSPYSATSRRLVMLAARASGDGGP